MLNLGVSAWEMISNQHFTEIALVSFQNLALVFILHLRNLHVKLAEQVQTTHTCRCTSCSLSIILLSVAFITALFTFSVVKEKYLLGLEKLKFDKIISMLENIICFTNGSLLVCACLVMDALEKAISLCDSYASLVLSNQLMCAFLILQTHANLEPIIIISVRKPLHILSPAKHLNHPFVTALFTFGAVKHKNEFIRVKLSCVILLISDVLGQWPFYSLLH